MNILGNTSLPSDLYTRNYIAARLIQYIALGAKKPLELVDFGGRSGELGSFVPDQMLHVIDIREPETAADKSLQQQGRYTVVNGLKAPFADHQFDLATSFEVLEHLNPQDREPLLSEMYRVSKIGLIVSLPVNSVANDEAERLLNKYFEQLMGEGHPWLKEHIENRPLPESVEVARVLKKMGGEVIAIPSNNLFFWTLFQYLAITAEKYPFDIHKAYKLYNENFSSIGDAEAPSYRTIFIALKPEYSKFKLEIETFLSQDQVSDHKRLLVLSTILDELNQIFLKATSEKDVHIRNLDAITQEVRTELGKKELEYSLQAQHQKNLQAHLESQGKELQRLASLAEEVEYIRSQVSQLEAQRKELLDQYQSARTAHKEEKEHFEEVISQSQSNIQALKSTISDKDQHIQNIEPSYRQLVHLHQSFLYRHLTRVMEFEIRGKRDLKAGLSIIKHEGLVPFLASFKRYLTGTLKTPPPTPQLQAQMSVSEQYKIFLDQHLIDVKSIQAEIKKFKYKPVVSIAVPVYNVDPRWLDACIQSVLQQLYPHWELCLYDDASTQENTIFCLKRWEGKDRRIKVKFGLKNLHISGATNQAIALASGEFIGLLDNDDELTVDALFEVVKALNKDRQLDFIYSDEDKLELDGTLTDPHFKPDFDLDLLLSINYISHFGVLRKSIGDRLGWMREGFQGSQDYDLYLRFIDESKRIYHIPKALYHWRKVPGSTAAVYQSKDYVDQASTRALSEYLQRNGIQGEALVQQSGLPFRVKRTITNPGLVSIIIPFKDKVELLRMCIPSILEKTTYKNFEILLVSNNSQDPKTLTYAKELSQKYKNIHFHEYNIPFNFSKINNWAVGKARGEYILLMNNDVEVIESEWLSAMVEHIQRPEVGAVGAKLLYPNDTIQHAGVILGINGVAGHSHKYFPRDSNGYFGRLNAIQDVSAVTGACLLVKKKLYEQLNGLEEENLRVAFNDVDFCLRIRQLGLLIVFTPFALLYHHESISRGTEDTSDKQQRFQSELKYMKVTHGSLLMNDPYYNPNLSHTMEDFSLRLS